MRDMRVIHSDGTFRRIGRTYMKHNRIHQVNLDKIEDSIDYLRDLVFDLSIAIYAIEEVNCKKIYDANKRKMRSMLDKTSLCSDLSNLVTEYVVPVPDSPDELYDYIITYCKPLQLGAKYFDQCNNSIDRKPLGLRMKLSRLRMARHRNRRKI